MAIPIDVPPDTLPRIEDEEVFVASVQEGIRDADAERTIPYEDVRRWLMSWGQPDEDQPPLP